MVDRELRVRMLDREGGVLVAGASWSAVSITAFLRVRTGGTGGSARNRGLEVKAAMESRALQDAVAGGGVGGGSGVEGEDA